ncbi:MAG: two-component system alkaline phosphatase synthesis response regulator PhoP [Parvicella sp.]|jgi:two-component system alkaline phosphatase synthesis response regulator PhoP
MNVLLVEDEKNLHEGIKLNLQLEGHKVLSAFDGISGLEQYKKSKIDLIILDVMLPNLNGFDLCQTIRLKDQTTPILFLTARDDIADKLKGLEMGGDDYLTKPFNLKELLLRVKNILKRSGTIESKQQMDEYKIGNCTVFFNSFLIKDSKSISHNITEKQLRLLKLLIDKKEQVVSRKEILQKVWEYETVPNTRTIDNVILSLRKIIEEGESTYIQSVRGVGYKYSEK